LALERGLLADDCVTLRAARSGSLIKVQWLNEVRKRPLPFNIGRWAVKGGKLELLTWLFEQGCNFDQYVTAAAAAGHKHLVCYLREQECEWNESTTAAAAENGHLSVVRWLLSAGCPFDAPRMCEGAARSGSVEMMVYARQQLGEELNAGVMQAAAETGRLTMCQYLHSEGCAWDAAAPNWAAHYGHLDTLRWLHEQGCPWLVGEVCKKAAQEGRIEIMHYLLRDLALATTELLQKMLDAAGARDNPVAAQWLRQQGADWPVSLYWWDEVCVTWARQQGCTVPRDIFEDDYTDADFTDDDY
jgi:hypothetical protein